MQPFWVILSFLTCAAIAQAQEVKSSAEIILLPKGPLRIERQDNQLLLRIPEILRDAVSDKWKHFRTIEDQDLPSIISYWNDANEPDAQNIPHFVLSIDVTGDGIPEVFLPIRHRTDPCRWRIIAIHQSNEQYTLYEVDNDHDGQRGPCAEEKPWYGFELAGGVGWVSVTYVPSSCFVANFTWSKDKGYVESEQE